jgi:hypothetical protein
MLVDSGSSHTFISAGLAARLQLPSRAIAPLRVKVANGGMLECNRELPNVRWSTQGVQFITSFKILPLGSYDIILGFDWLSKHSPMKVHWAEQTMNFEWEGRTVYLSGAQVDATQCTAVSADQLRSLVQKSQVARVMHLFLMQPTPSSSEDTIPPVVQPILSEFGHLFEEPQGLPPQRQFDHAIPLLPGAKPVNLRPYRFNPAQKDEVEKEVAQMLAQGIIQLSSSPYASPVILVLKKDLTWRFCVDFRQLNAITVKNRYPLPVIDELLDELSGSIWFTSLDLRVGYHQIRMRPEDEHKTAFKTHQGHYEFKVMAYGLTGAPATFQGLMNTILQPLLRRGVLVFIDDILIYSKDLQSHLALLRQVFLILTQHQLKIKRSKCKFLQPQLVYLGHEISGAGVTTDQKNIVAVAKWPSPENLKQVRGFLGLVGYYRKFVRNFGIISRPLTDLLKKSSVFCWTALEEASFSALKQALVSAPVLALPDFSCTFEIETDASDNGIGAVLIQNKHPLAFLSKALGPRSSALSTYEKEALAIIMAVDHWRPYLQPAEFIVHSDQKSLIHLEEQRISTPWQQKVMMKLLGLRYRIVYKKGQDNRAADALSRCPQPATGELAAVSVCLPTWLEEVRLGYHADPLAQKLLVQLAAGVFISSG